MGSTDRRDPAAPTQVVVEVTNTLSVDFTTGIQRVVREVVNGLDGPAGDGLEVVPVVTPAVGADFRRLTDDERARLRTHPAGGRAGRRADDFGPLSPLVRRVGDLPLTLRARAVVAARRNRRREILPGHAELSLGPIERGAIPAGSVFADIEGSWYNPTPRAELLPRPGRCGGAPARAGPRRDADAVPAVVHRAARAGVPRLARRAAASCRALPGQLRVHRCRPAPGGSGARRPP